MPRQAFKKILIVESNEKLRYSMKEGFRKLGYQVKAYGDAQKALASMAMEHPQFVFLSAELRSQNWLAILEAIKTLPGRPPYVALVANPGQADDAITAIENGCCETLLKPFVFTDLLACVRRAEDRVHIN